MAGTTVTTRAKKKMLEARAGIAALPKIVGMAFGTGGVNSAGEIVAHSPDQNALHKEVLRKDIDGYTVVSDTKIRYSCTPGYPGTYLQWYRRAHRRTGRDQGRVPFKRQRTSPEPCDP